MKLEFFAPGTPRPQGSKRHVGNGRYIEASRHLTTWRYALITTAKRAHNHRPPITEPVRVTTEFVMPRPKRLRGKPTPPHTARPDIDKLQRAVGDALTQADIITDDSHITHWTAHKRYANDNETEGVHITITQEGAPQ